MPIIAIINLILFTALVSLLYQLSKNESFTLSRRVFMGLVGGSVFGVDKCNRERLRRVTAYDDHATYSNHYDRRCSEGGRD